MLKNYITTAFRNILGSKLYSAINIVGLAIGLAACVLIMLFVRDELSYDKFWANADKIHRLHVATINPGRGVSNFVQSPGLVKWPLKSFFSEEIERVTRFSPMQTTLRYGDGVFSESITWTDPETVDMFDFSVVAGDLRAALSDNASLAVNQSFARKHFGEDDPIGKVVTLNLYEIERDYRVAAVFEDLPHNTVLAVQAMVLIDEKDFKNQPWKFASWTGANNYVYFQLKPGISIETVNRRMSDFTDASIPPRAAGGGDVKTSEFTVYSTQPLVDIQLEPKGRNGAEMKPTGNRTNVLIFSAIASLILLIACINFVNLATARSLQRAREVALRKVVGARRSQLVIQFLGETIVVACIGLLLGIVLVELFLSPLGDFVGKELKFDYADGATLSILAGLVLAVGCLGGVYPALVLSGFLPARVLKANRSAEASGSATLRGLLVVMQFAISVALIIATGVVAGQRLYATGMDPGFNKENLLVVRNIDRAGAWNKRDALKEEILRLPEVKMAAFSFDAPSSGWDNDELVTVPGNEAGQPISIGRQAVDYGFFDMYEIPIIAGRDYSRARAAEGMPAFWEAKPGQKLEGSIIVNEGAVRSFGFGTPEESIGKVVNWSVDGTKVDMTIIGVIPDIPYQSLRKDARPEMYQLAWYHFRNLTVRFDGNGSEVAGRIENVWKSLITTVPFEYNYVDETMAEEFEKEASQSILLAIFAGLAVVIACLGLYGLAAYMAERRTREIGIRKVMGASVMDIVRLLVWQFSKPVIIANIIAWPLAAWGMMMWLESFPYRLDTWVLVPLCMIAGFLALAIAWATVGGNAAKVARANPINALRYE